jgi:hypothetical protein
VCPGAGLDAMEKRKVTIYKIGLGTFFLAFSTSAFMILISHLRPRKSKKQ